MELFNLKATIHLFESFREFSEAFSLGPRDLIFTESPMYDRYVKPAELKSHVLLKDNYSLKEPDEETVDAILRDMEGMELDRIIAIGGGSVIDIAKILCVRNAFPVKDVMSHKTPPVHDKELVVLPSTCGTGSEVTYGGIITMKDTGLKTAIMDSTLVSKHAVLVPELLEGLPYRVFVHCSIDALGHSMESFVSATRGNEFARAVGARSIKLLTEGYAKLAEYGEEAKAGLLKDFIQASCLGGLAVNNGGAGPVHALAYPLGEVYNMSHGESIYEFLTEVFMHYERVKGGELLDELKLIISPSLKKAGIAADSCFEGLRDLLEKVYPNRRLREAGMREEEIVTFTDSVFEAKQRLLAASYSGFTKEDAMRIYRERY